MGTDVKRMTGERRSDGAEAGATESASAEARRKRKAALLRENLMRRKAQQRERRADGQAEGQTAPESGE